MQMKHLVGILVVGILLVVAAFAYVHVQISQPANPSRDPGVLGGIATTSLLYEYSEQAPHYSIDIVYPSSTGLAADADTKARATLENRLSQEIDSFRQNSLQNLSADEQAGVFENGRVYELQIICTPSTSPHLVSYQCTEVLDTGGAHPNQNFITFVFDEEGNNLALADLFVPGADYLDPISESVTAEVTQQLTAEGVSQGGEAMPIFEDGVAPNAENFSAFVVEGDTLHMLIPPYQAAAYAAGDFDISIPFDSLQSLLKPNIP